MSRRQTTDPTTDEYGREVHPSWGMIGASRVTTGPTGVALFDSDIRHAHTISVRISTASRSRDLHHDHLMSDREFVEVEMSEAQWASFVSSINVGNGVPCTIRRREDEHMVPGAPFAPRLQESMDEVRDAASESTLKVQAAFAAYAEHKTAANLRTLEYAIKNMPANITFAAKSLSEHAENVVQRGRADIEAMVVSKAQQLGLEPADLGLAAAQLGEGSE